VCKKIGIHKFLSHSIYNHENQIAPIVVIANIPAVSISVEA